MPFLDRATRSARFDFELSGPAGKAEAILLKRMPPTRIAHSAAMKLLKTLSDVEIVKVIRSL